VNAFSEHIKKPYTERHKDSLIQIVSSIKRLRIRHMTAAARKPTQIPGYSLFFALPLGRTLVIRTIILLFI